MYVPEIIEVKDHLEKMKAEGLIQAWELPYENILTRRSAAIFFASGEKEKLVQAWEQLSGYSNFSFRENAEQKLSKLQYRITFSKEEKEKNEAKKDEVNVAS